jgi:hypothetical protein
MRRFACRQSGLLLSITMGLLALPCMAKDSQIFHQYKIDLPFSVTQPVIAADVLSATGVELLIVGMDGSQQRILAIYGFDEPSNSFKKLEHISIKPEVIAFDVGEANSESRQNIYLLSKTSIDRFIPANLPSQAEIKQEQIVSSMYVTDKASSFSHKDFAKDVNDDGLDDFVLPHFEQLNLWLTDCCGDRHFQSLPIAARLEVRDSSVSYDDVELYTQDMNLDGLTDLVIIEQGTVSVFNQNSDKRFASGPVNIAIDPSISGIDWWNLKGPTDENLDQSDLMHRKVADVMDFNGDGIPDLAVEFTKSTGVLDKIVDYEIFYGQLVEGKLTYSLQANTSIKSKKTLSGLSFTNTNGDNKQEMVVSSYDIGIGQIIGALLSGSIDQDLMIFSMDEDEQFSEKPLVNQEVKITFSLSSGTTGEPLTRVADINGDSVKDIVFSDGDDTIRVLLATPGAKAPYARRSLSQKTVMPKNASEAESFDLNADGKMDFVLHYGRIDSAELQQQILVLMAR